MRKNSILLIMFIISFKAQSAISFIFPIPAITAPVIACYATGFSTVNFLINERNIDGDFINDSKDDCYMEALSFPFSALIAGFVATIDLPEISIFRRILLSVYGLVLLNADHSAIELVKLDIQTLPKEIKVVDAIEYNEYITELEMIINTVSIEAENNPNLTVGDSIILSHSLMDDMNIPIGVRSTFKAVFAKSRIK